MNDDGDDFVCTEGVPVGMMMTMMIAMVMMISNVKGSSLG